MPAGASSWRGTPKRSFLRPPLGTAYAGRFGIEHKYGVFAEMLHRCHRLRFTSEHSRGTIPLCRAPTSRLSDLSSENQTSPMVHPTADIEPGVTIGLRTRIW